MQKINEWHLRSITSNRNLNLYKAITGGGGHRVGRGQCFPVNTIYKHVPFCVWATSKDRVVLSVR